MPALDRVVTRRQVGRTGLGGVLRQRHRVLDEFDTMALRTLEGQATELGWRRDNVADLTPEDYLGDVMGDVSRRRGILQGQDDSPGGKVIAALRNEFGGHAVTKAGEAGVLTDH